MANEFLGTWRIREMDTWDQEYVDLVVPGFMKFERYRSGSFQFATVSGGIDWRYRVVAGIPTIEWCRDGWSDTDHGSGRGWAVVKDMTLVGHIFIFGSDDSRFVADRQKPGQHARRVAGRRHLRGPS
jgi:hypothetical protein